VDDTLPHLVSAADHFKVAIMCREGQPILPTIKLTVSIAKPDFSYARYIPSALPLDLILSRDALNAMKLEPNESHVYIPKMLLALKPGGMAVCQTDYGADYIYHDVPGFREKPFTILGVWNVRYDGGTVSFLYYKRRELPSGNPDWDKKRAETFYYSFFGLVIKRCLPGEQVTAWRGCILPQRYGNVFPQDLKLWKAPMSSWKPARREAIPERIQYAFDYHANLMKQLHLWEQGGLPVLAST